MAKTALLAGPLRIATKRAFESSFERARVGAVLVRGGRILESACNSIRGASKIQKRIPESLHAEQAVIIRMLNTNRQHLIAGATIYVTRINNHGKTSLAKPCETCAQILRDLGIKRVYYTTGNPGEPVAQDRY
jgi:deoxycytidylate deaminase